jgi:hypothetical protein
MSKEIHIVFQVLNYLHSNNSLDLIDAEKLVLITLASHKGVKGIYPSVKTLARELKKGESTVRRLIAQLKDKKLIEVETMLGKANHYFLTELIHTPLTHERGIPADPSHLREGGPLTHERGTPLTGEHIRTNRNNKGIKERGRTVRATPLTVDFELSESTIERLDEFDLGEELTNVIIEKFMTHYIGTGEEKSDWQSVLINWFIREIEFMKKDKKSKSEADAPKSTIPWFKPEDEIRRGDPQAIGKVLSRVIEQAKPKSNGQGGQRGIESKRKGTS